jgi:hypothetical protein
MPDKRVEDILAKYGGRIENEMSGSGSKTDYSKSYMVFKKERIPVISRYERWAKSFGTIIKLRVKAADALRVKKHLDVAHLDLEPWQPLTLSVMSFLGILFLGVLVSLAILLIGGSFPFLFFFLAVIFSLNGSCNSLCCSLYETYP